MAVLDRVPMGDISAAARAMTFGRTMLTLVAGILFGLGWVVAKTFTGGWFVLAWCFAAVKVGWTQARGPDGAS